MCHYVRNHFKHIIAWFSLYKITKTFSSIMIALININAQIISQQLIAIINVFLISYLCANMSEITLKITLHVIDTKTFYSIMIVNDNHQCTIHFLCNAEIDCSNNILHLIHSNMTLFQKSL